MKYSKITHGFVESVFEDGRCISQEFFPVGDVDLRDENDEAIEDKAVIEEIEQKEMHCALEMVQPRES